MDLAITFEATFLGVGSTLSSESSESSEDEDEWCVFFIFPDAAFVDVILLRGVPFVGRYFT